MTMQQQRGFATTRRQRGFALLIVLWALVLITLLVTHLAAQGRGETRLAGKISAAAKLEALADGAVHEAIFHSLDSTPAAWAADGRVHVQDRSGLRITARITDEAGRINPSNATPELLQALMRQLGANTATASAIAAAIVEWRTPYGQKDLNLERFDRYRAAGRTFGPPGAAFLSFDDIAAVYGMTPDLLARLTPHLSLYTQDDPDPAAADPIVLAALTALNGGRPPAPKPSNPQLRVLDIEASVTAGDDSFTRRATVRVLGGQPSVLSWQSVPRP